MLESWLLLTCDGCYMQQCNCEDEYLEHDLKLCAISEPSKICINTLTTLTRETNLKRSAAARCLNTDLEFARQVELLVCRSASLAAQVAAATGRSSRRKAGRVHRRSRRLTCAMAPTCRAQTNTDTSAGSARTCYPICRSIRLLRAGRCLSSASNR